MTLEELARRIVGLFEYALYDPVPEVDGYTREEMIEERTEAVLDLLREANVKVG